MPCDYRRRFKGNGRGVFISLTHFKGHEMAGFGGTLKNIGMGCGSRAGKMEQHCDGKPSVDQSGCIGCGACSRICAHGAPIITDGKAKIDHEKCVGCGRCLAMCPKDVIATDFSDSIAVLNYKMAEYSLVQRQTMFPCVADLRCVAQLRLPCGE